MIEDQRQYESRYLDERIDVTGRTFCNCVFDGCVVERRPDPNTRLWGCLLTNCQLVGDGWPQNEAGDRHA